MAIWEAPRGLACSEREEQSKEAWDIRARWQQKWVCMVVVARSLMVGLFGGGGHTVKAHVDELGGFFKRGELLYTGGRSVVVASGGGYDEQSTAGPVSADGGDEGAVDDDDDGVDAHRPRRGGSCRSCRRRCRWRCRRRCWRRCGRRPSGLAWNRADDGEGSLED